MGIGVLDLFFAVCCIFYLPKTLPAFFGPRELSAFMGIGITKAYQLSRSVGFPAIRIGKNIRISRDGLRRWVQMQTEEEI